MACAPGARHFCDIYAASTTQPTSKAIFTLPKLWPVRSDTAGKRFLVHAMLHPSLTCFFRMVDVLRPHPSGCGRFSHMVGADTQLFQCRQRVGFLFVAAYDNTILGGCPRPFAAA